MPFFCGGTRGSSEKWKIGFALALRDAQGVKSLVFLFLLFGLARAEHGVTKEWLSEVKEMRRNYEKAVDGLVVDQRWGQSGDFFAKVREKGKDVWYRFQRGDWEKERVKKAEKRVKKTWKRSGLGKRLAKESPDQKWRVEGGREELRLIGEQEERRVEFQLAEGCGWTGRVMWAPNSKAFVAWYRSSHPVHQLHLIESSPGDQLQPKHTKLDYPKPGQKINVARPVVFLVDGRKGVEIGKGLEAFEFREGRWMGQRFVVEFIERGFGKYQLIEYDVEKGSERVLLGEESGKFVYVYGNCFRYDLLGGEEILWLSQRTGMNHLYLVDGKTGETKRALTSGDWLVRKVIEVDEVGRRALLKIAGYYKKQDPYYIHYAWVNFDDGKLEVLTDADGTHELEYSADGKFYWVSWSRVDLPPVVEIRDAETHQVVADLGEADVSGLDVMGYSLPERFVVKDRNGKFDIHGIIMRPLNFEVGWSYPVVESIYAGPHGSFVPKGWRKNLSSEDELLAAGFVVVRIDGLGTNHRGQEFHEFAYKNLMDSGFPNRIKWIKAAGEKYQELDLGRVGIYGGSAGGQSTLAGLLNHPEFYRVGVAHCGCHDNRLDKIWWNEQWMDYPIDKSYEENSNVTHAGKLQGALMLTLGELDRNVDPASTYRVVDALIKADRDFDFVVVPGGGHGADNLPYVRRKRVEFFQKNLGE